MTATHSPIFFLGATLFALGCAVPGRAADELQTGEQIYRRHCASCHGTSGEGSKAYPRALAGDNSLEQLVRLITKTMPENKPGSLSADEVKKVSAHVFDNYYSKSAQERNKPRIELARLTIGQYRNVVADLVGSFRSAPKAEFQHGLHAEYFDARDFRRDKRVIDRLDPQVKFDFGKTGPIADKFDPYQFSIRWEGSIYVPETGECEFIVRTEHAFRLWINDNRVALLDAWVKSGSEDEQRASLFLLGGRLYPLKLEFSKAKQGVDDSKNNKDKPVPKASIELMWKPPKRIAETIPARNLSPTRFPEVFVVTTHFPPDDRSLGWERGTAISKAWDSAETDAAIETASYVSARLGELAGLKDGASDRDARARDFCKRFVSGAFRRPLTPEQQKLFIDRQFEATKDPEAAIRRVVLLALKSPRFLYREVGGGPDAVDVANRLAFALWDSAPDAELLKAATDGKLNTREEVTQQAHRMLEDPRAHAKLREFFLIWLRVDQFGDIMKDPKRFPGFDSAILTDLRTSFEMFLEEVIWGQNPDFRDLLLADTLYLNGRLAKFYGAELPADAKFQKMSLNPEQRAGILTHPYLMANFAYATGSSPIHRGVFLTRGILGITLRPPPEAVTPVAEDLHPKLTTRERVITQTKAASCQTCHGVINPLGFTLENFDAVGKFRDKDNNKPVDATGSYLTRKGQTVTFSGIKDLARFLAKSDEVHSAFVEQMFHHLVKQPVRAYGSNTLADLRKSFAEKNFNIRELAIDISVSSALSASNKKDQPAPKPAKK